MRKLLIPLALLIATACGRAQNLPIVPVTASPASCPNALPLYVILVGYAGAGDLYGNSGTGSSCALLASPGGGGSGVSSVSNLDGTLTITPTTGNVVASLALGHANTWTGAITAPSFSADGPCNGGTAGCIALVQGTAPSSLTANAVTRFAPTSVTAYGIVDPPAIGSASQAEVCSPSSGSMACVWQSIAFNGGVALTNYLEVNAAAAQYLCVATAGNDCVFKFTASGGDEWWVASKQAKHTFYFYDATSTIEPFAIYAQSGNTWLGLNTTAMLGWTAATGDQSTAVDTAFSRISAGVVAIGNGTTGNTTGQLDLGSFVATAAAPTVAASQIGYGSTVAASTNCGTVGTGCIVVNVAGTTRYITYY